MNDLKRYCYGPFNSRRLGLSLGIDILPRTKVCTYNCVYCEIGHTKPDQLVSPEYRVKEPPSQGFQKELESRFVYTKNLDSITFGYNGEPTLNENILDFLNIAENLRDKVEWAKENPKLTLFTNSSTLPNQEIRKKVKEFDLILAKLDAGNDDDFKRVNCPHKDTPNIDVIIENLAKLKKEMPEGHKLAIQCLICDSYITDYIPNNNPNTISDLALALKKIKPDYVQVYSIARMPANYYVFSIDDERKQQIVAEFNKVINDPQVEVKYY